MATILRYAKYLRQNGSISKRLNITQSHIESNIARLRPQLQRVTISTRNYATNSVDRHSNQIYAFEKSFQTLEVQLRRSGRTSRSDIEKILREIQLAGNVPSLDALLLVRCCGKPLLDQNPKKGVQLVQEIWDTLERLKIPMDASHYNALLSVYLERGHEFSPAEFLQTMLDKQIVPNRVTYHRLIDGYCRIGDIANATKIIDMMRKNNFPLCETVFNSLITGHSMANDLKNAEATVETMKAAGLEPSAETYAALLCAYARVGDMPSITQLMAKIQSLEIILLDHQLMDIIETLATSGFMDKAKEFSQQLPKEIRGDTDVGRLLIKLMELKETKLALEILKNTTTDVARFKIRTGFLLRVAANSKNFTTDEIISLCNTLETEGLHPRPFSAILYYMLAGQPRPNVAISLMHEWKKQGGEIREHFFWPLLRSASQASDYQAILDILHSMLNDFKINPTVDTLRDYTIPFMFGTWENIIGKLVPLGIPRITILEAIAHRSVIDRKLRNAMMFMMSYPIKYSKDLFLEPMATSLNMFDDTKSFVTLLRFLGDETVESSGEIPHETPMALVDEALSAVLAVIPKYRSGVLEKMLLDLEAAGLSISPAMGETLKSFLEAQKATELEPLITKLSSGELKPVPLEQFNTYIKERTSEYIKRPSELNIVDLRAQFANCLDTKNEEKALKILKQLQLLDYQSPAVLAQALDLFCSTENVDAAEYCFNQFKEHCRDSGLDTMKILSFTALLVKKDRMEDAMKVLAEAPILDDTEKQSRGIRSRVRNLLESTADTKHIENTYQLFEVLKTKNYITFDNYILGPLVKIHVLRNEIGQAMEVFEKLCNEYKCTPYKNVLASVLIDAEDANSLQKLTDLCTEVHGESNALVDLALLFLEAGRPIQARKILETSGIHIFNEKITNAVSHFVSIGRPECVELLPKITRSVMRIDRAHMYNTLLDHYEKKNDWQKGLSLWTEMQEIDVQPTNYFITTLSLLLTRNKQPVPFINQSETIRPSDRIVRRTRVRKGFNGGERFQEALRRKNWAGAEDILRSQMRGRKEERYLYSELIRAILAAGDVDRAADISRTIIQEHSGMPKRMFSSVCDELIKQEKYSTIEDLGSGMTESVKDDLDFYKILSRCQIAKLGIKKYVTELKIDHNDDVFRSVEKKLHFGAMLHGLLEEPEFVEDYEEWARNMADKQISRAMHVLWNYHFLMNNAKSDAIWSSFIINSPSPLVRPIVELSVQRKDPLLLKRLTKKLESHPRLNTGTMCRVISGLIKAYNATGQYDEGLNVLREGAKRYRLDLFALDALEDLKQGIEQSGKVFPFEINRGADAANHRPDERLQEIGRA